MQMNMKQDCSASGARQIYKFRPYQNIVIGFAIFIPIALLFTLFLNAWITGGIAFITAFCAYYFLESRVLIIQCPNCGKDIDTNTPWLCGFKSCRNENVDHQHPFIHECEKCHYPPKAYECHHCHEPIYLTTDRQKIHMAKFLVGLERVKVKRDVLGEKVAIQKEEVSDLEHVLKTETIKKQIKITKKPPATPVIKSAEQALENEIEACVNQGMALIDVEKRLLDKADVEYANDEHKRQQKHAFIKREIFNRMDGGS
jgi:hypothetical protein